MDQKRRSISFYDSALIQELERAGIKHTPEDILGIARDQTDRIVFLETGNARAGFTHIANQHSVDFANQGIAESQLSEFILNAVIRGKIVEYQGKGGTRPVFEHIFNGQRYLTGVTIGSNGFIVGANPR
ncbi:hypothetical protein [Anthocerotibacter panamensis]|uniref:hypothetical protein n=1 Tax=Anthocerotibacter panamensis TaxID=2857077 RepID=UPI001C408658|nr:hypothetical protein [Anthocerotibacter panamensis]